MPVEGIDTNDDSWDGGDSDGCENNHGLEAGGKNRPRISPGADVR